VPDLGVDEMRRPQDLARPQQMGAYPLGISSRLGADAACTRSRLM
jgi:hypothetical protein